MFRQIIICLTLLFVVAGEELAQPGPPDSCFKTSFHINDEYHKDVPSPEGSEFPECQSWKESSCCTLALAETLSKRGKVQGLYNFSHDLCDQNISAACAEYLRVCTIAVVMGKTLVAIKCMPFVIMMGYCKPLPYPVEIATIAILYMIIIQAS